MSIRRFLYQDVFRVVPLPILAPPTPQADNPLLVLYPFVLGATYHSPQPPSAAVTTPSAFSFNEYPIVLRKPRPFEQLPFQFTPPQQVATFSPSPIEILAQVLYSDESTFLQPPPAAAATPTLSDRTEATSAG